MIFIILITSVDLLWRESYRCIRTLYPESPIVIINDEEIDISSLELITLQVYPSTSNLSPFYYLRDNPIPEDENVVILHDTMMIREHLDISKDRMLWSKRSPNLDMEVEVLTLMGGDLLLQHRKRTVPSCYKSCYILSSSTISKLEDTPLFNPVFNTRRSAIDSLITTICLSVGVEEEPLIGAIEDHPYHPSYNVGEYVLGIIPDMPVIEIVGTVYKPVPGEEYIKVDENDVTRIIGNSRTLCLFATYNVGSLPANTALYINELASLYDIVVVLATGMRISVESLNHNVRLIYGPNKNYDFGLWSIMMMHINPDKIDEIALVNDSCQIVQSLTNTITYIRSSGERFTGITDNYDKEYHIQSYFLVCIGYACISRIKEFFKTRDLDATYDYSSTVLYFETKLTTFMKEIVDVRVLYPIENIHILRTTGSAIGGKILEINQYNSAWMLWDVLLALGCPLLKKKRFKSMISPAFERTLLTMFGREPYTSTII